MRIKHFFIIFIVIMVVSVLNNFNILTLNVRGNIKNGRHRNKLLSIINNNEINIALLQETHVSNLSYKKNIDMLFNCQSLWSFGTNNSCGVAVLLMNNFEFEIKQFKRDSEGRIISVKLITEHGQMNIINSYAPNQIRERKEFINSIDRYISGNEVKILGGDWNCVENLRLDKIGGNPNNDNERARQIENIKKEYDLKDPFRTKYGNEKCYTWSCDHSGIKTRLDRFYVSNDLLKQLKDVKNKICNISDHEGVILQFKNCPKTDFISGTGSWKFNTSLLKKNSFVDEIKHKWELMNSHTVKDWDWWESFKCSVKEIAIKHSKVNQKRKIKELEKIEDGIKQLNCLIENCSDESITRSMQVEKNILKDRIDQFYHDELKAAQIRSKCDKLTHNESPSSNFLRVEASKAKHMVVKELKSGTGNLTKNTNENLICTEKFYGDLYKFENVDNQYVEYFTENLPQVPTNLSEMCDMSLEIVEIEKSMKSMKNGKSPGSDGIPIEFYKFFWDEIGSTFCNIIKDEFEENHQLNSSQRIGIIRLISKTGKNETDLKNYRPISLLNTDYKIIAKCIANRLKQVLPHIIHEDQTFGIKGRSIQDNLIFLNSLFAYIEHKNLPAVFLNVDQEKAFDRVSHKFLFQVIEKFGFGVQFQNYIKTLYSGLNSKVLVNGFLSKPIDVKRSVRQGCPIAPLLYICVIEPLLINIRNNPEIIGIKSPTSDNYHLVSAFADDTGFITQDTQSTEKIIITFCKFGKASGSRTNMNKTEGMLLGCLKNHEDLTLDIKWVKTTKSLGIIFGHGDLHSLNWLKCLDRFRSEIRNQLRRHVTLQGKADILNHMGYSKLWYKSLVLSLPDGNCIRQNNNTINIKGTIDKLSQGFIWGFSYKADETGLDFNNPKNPRICKKTLYLDKCSGGLKLIDYNLKMKAFRILLVYKFFDQNYKKWKEIVSYWFEVNLYSISRRRWNNNYPHSSSLNNIPTFFKQCLIEFKTYYLKHKRSINQTIDSKIIYADLIKEMNHTPVAISKYPVMEFVFPWLVKNKFLDPFLREFLYKMYHCRLIFKKYQVSLNDMLNFEQKCILCHQSIDTPRHSFIFCVYGQSLRRKKNEIIDKINQQHSITMSEENIIYCNVDLTNQVGETLSYILALSNYSICKVRMKKFYDPATPIDLNEPLFIFLREIKRRIYCDHKRLEINIFRKKWDENNDKCLIDYDNNEIISWKF